MRVIKSGVTEIYDYTCEEIKQRICPICKAVYESWGEHIVDENTLWKEHTYPSEPVEINFLEWIRGFIRKYVSND